MTDMNQCDYCAFLLKEDQSTAENVIAVEKKYSAIRSAIGAPLKSKRVFVGGGDDRTETCFIDAPAWNKRKENIHCPDRIDATLSLVDAISLRETKIANSHAANANSVAGTARIWAIIATVIAVIAIILPYIVPLPK